MDREAVGRSAAIALLIGAVLLLVGWLVLRSALNAWSPSGFRLFVGWATVGVGGMLLQGSVVGFIVSSGRR